MITMATQSNSRSSQERKKARHQQCNSGSSGHARAGAPGDRRVTSAVLNTGGGGHCLAARGGTEPRPTPAGSGTERRSASGEPPPRTPNRAARSRGPGDPAAPRAPPAHGAPGAAPPHRGHRGTEELVLCSKYKLQIGW